MAQVFEVGADNSVATKFLESYIQSGNMNFLIGSGASFPAIKTAGNIEKEINDLLKEGKDSAADAKCVEFIEGINKANSSLISKFGASFGSGAGVKKVAASYVTFLGCIDEILFARKNILLPRQANIFTTNYDMFVEYAASALPSVILNDGFDRSARITSKFNFAPERYFDRTYRSGALHTHQTEIPTVNLVKLHGSVSWRRDKDTVVFQSEPVKALSVAEKAEQAKIAEFLEKHFLILPNFRKFQATLIDRVYYDLLRLFSKAMDQQNVALISFGFSFSDEHILDITRRALRNPTSQLIVFSFDKASSGEYLTKFSKQRNVTVISPDAGTKMDFDRFNIILRSTLQGPSDAA